MARESASCLTRPTAPLLRLVVSASMAVALDTVRPSIWVIASLRLPTGWPPTVRLGALNEPVSAS